MPARLQTMPGIALGLALLVLSACCAPKPPAASTPYFGPTESIVEVVSAINRNNAQLPTVWASHYIEADLADGSGSRSTVNADGALLFRRPGGFLLFGSKPGIGRVFEIGSTGEHYWLKLAQPDPSRLWYGEHRNVGKPCVEQLAVPPQLLMEVLGIGLIGTDFTQFPAPVMRFNPDHRSYMFVWVAPAGGAEQGPGRLVAQREVWYDMQTKLPTLVILFDTNGRPILRAKLRNHVAVDPATGIDEDDEEDEPTTRPAVPRDRWPKVATDYDLLFPDSGSQVKIQLQTVRIAKDGVPTRRGIAFPGTTPQDAGVSQVIWLDRRCKE
jgi:hypothetical protein